MCQLKLSAIYSLSLVTASSSPESTCLFPKCAVVTEYVSLFVGLPHTLCEMREIRMSEYLFYENISGTGSEGFSHEMFDIHSILPFFPTQSCFF